MCLCAIQQSNGETTEFMCVVDDHQVCIIHNFCLIIDEAETETARLLVDNLMMYVQQKEFLYIELFDCPVSVLLLL